MGVRVCVGVCDGDVMRRCGHECGCNEGLLGPSSSRLSPLYIYYTMVLGVPYPRCRPMPDNRTQFPQNVILIQMTMKFSAQDSLSINVGLSIFFIITMLLFRFRSDANITKMGCTKTEAFPLYMLTVVL